MSGMSGDRGSEGPLVFLTGASGFVGRHVAQALLDAGFRVRAGLRKASPSLPRGVEPFAIADLSRPQDWTAALAGVDSVVHGAGIAHAGPGIPDAAYDRVNRAATLELADAAAGRVRRFVFLSSIRAQSGPSSDHVLSEDDPPAPTDAYGRSKLAAEEALAQLALSATALRPVVVYGEGVGGNFGQLLRLARLPLPLPFGALDAKRSVLGVDNLAEAVVFALQSPGPLQGPLIVADPQPVTLAELIAGMRRAMGRRPLLAPVPQEALKIALSAIGSGDLWTRLGGAMAADPARLLSLGWSPPSATTAEGLARWLGPRVPGA